MSVKNLQFLAFRTPLHHTHPIEESSHRPYKLFFRYLCVRPKYIICIQRVFLSVSYNIQTIKLVYIMSCLYLLFLFFLASSFINRDNLSDAHFRYMSHIGERLCFPQPKTVVNSRKFTLKMPCLHMCTNRRLRFLPISKLPRSIYWLVMSV